MPRGGAGLTVVAVLFVALMTAACDAGRSGIRSGTGDGAGTSAPVDTTSTTATTVTSSSTTETQPGITPYPTTTVVHWGNYHPAMSAVTSKPEHPVSEMAAT
jgi:hypothetical protein